MNTKEIQKKTIIQLRAIGDDNGVLFTNCKKKGDYVAKLERFFSDEAEALAAEAVDAPSDEDQKKEKAKSDALAASKVAKGKKTKPLQAIVLAQQAIKDLVKSGSKAVTFKENKTGSVMWVKFHEVTNPLENAVLSNVRKAAAAVGKGYTTSSVTLCRSGSIGAWFKRS